MIINIGIVNKFATAAGVPVIVCGNGDYTIHFTFDDEWDGLDYKTARFTYLQNGAVRFQDFVFEGDTVAVPVLSNTREVLVGVFAGDLRTTSPAAIPCEPSIRCGTGAPEEPTPSVYDQIMELLNQGGSDEDPGPSHELQSYAASVQKAQTPTTLTLALMADTHYCENENGAQDKLETAKTMGLLSNYINVDIMANLGDFVRGDEVKATTQKDLARLIVSTNQNAKCPVFYIRGNHDDNGWYSLARDGNPGTRLPSEMFNDTEWYQMAFGFARKDVVIDSNKPNGGYGYYDHAASKIRVFLLNTNDIPYIVEDNGTYRYNAYQCSAFSNEQLNFVANALKFEDKDNPNEWAAMFLMHIPLDTTTANGYRFGAKHELVRGIPQMLSIITAYKNGIAYSFSGSINSQALKDENDNLIELPEHFPVNIDVDYSTKGVGDVICFVNGHTHIDNASRKVGVEGSLSYGYTYLGIIGATAFATMVVDREKSVVTTFKYGEVITISDRVDPETGEIRDDYKGTIDGEAELTLDMKTGVWEVPFDQFRPTGGNLYDPNNGLSSKYKPEDGNGYIVDVDATLDTATLELSSAIVVENAEYKMLTKAVAIKASTQYIIPASNGINVYFYRVVVGATTGNLAPNYISTTDGDNCTIITTGQYAGSGYLVFAFNTNVYTDYENFYIRENIGG